MRLLGKVNKVDLKNMGEKEKEFFDSIEEI
jgi:hypothetical protein